VVLTVKVEKLKVNFKTLEEFKRFKEYGIQELSMLEDLEHQMVEHESDSPFYGIYFGDKLVARMSLYQVDAKFDRYFYPPQSYFELWKLEVLPQYQKKGFGKILVDFAKEFELPIKVNPKVQSAPFWEKMDFKTVEYEMDRDLGENPLVWYPKGVEAQ
jgi:GNAT superfamily N-acetyltransferase